MPGTYRGWQAGLAVAAAVAVIGATIAAGALAPESATAATSRDTGAGSAQAARAARQALPPVVLVRSPSGVGPGVVSDEHGGRGSQRALGADRVNLEVQLASDAAPPPAGSPGAGPASRAPAATLPPATRASTLIGSGAAP